MTTFSTSTMDTSDIQSITQRIGVIQDLMEEVLTIEKEGDPNKDIIERVKEIVQESGNIAETAKTTSEMIIDGKILSVSGHIVKSHILKFDTNLISFNPEQYSDGIYSYVESKSEHEIDWDCLASDTYSMFKKVPPLDFKLGTFTLDPPPPPEKVKAERQKKSTVSSKTVVSAVATEENEISSEPKDEIYQHILKCMVRLYKRNNRQPLEYFKFVIDPTDFWTSVQNIFHFSFLVRDSKVKMCLNDAGLPVVEPVLNNVKDSHSNKILKNSQFAFRITPNEWRQFIKVFEISEPAITPFQS